MFLVLKIFAVLLAIFILVLVHEYGHFLAARLFKVKVLRFSIGFGKPFFKRVSRKTGTEFVIAPWLLGGYVKLLDANEVDLKPQERHLAFNDKSVWQRAVIAIAGIVANVILAFFAFWLMFIVGITTPKPIVGKVLLLTQAARLKIVPGDEIVAISNHSTPSWQDVVLRLYAHLGNSGAVKLELRRGGKLLKNLSLNLDAMQVDSYNPDLLKSLGIEPYHPVLPPIIAGVTSHGAAARAGIVAGDRILELDGNKMRNWAQLIKYVKARPNMRINVLLIRNGVKKHIELTSSWRFSSSWKKEGFLGIKSKIVAWPQDLQRTFQYSPVKAFVPAVNKLIQLIDFNFIVIAKLVSGKISLHILGGPISVFQSAVIAVRQGLAIYLGFLGLLSIMLALVNLLPIPVLDGGALLFLLIEAVRRKPVSLRVQMLFYKFGLVFLLLLMVHATYNDVMRML